MRTAVTKYIPKKTTVSYSMTSHVSNYILLDVVIMLDIAQTDEHIFIRYCVSTLDYVVKSKIAVNMIFFVFFTALKLRKFAHLHNNVKQGILRFEIFQVLLSIRYKMLLYLKVLHVAVNTCRKYFCPKY